MGSQRVCELVDLTDIRAAAGRLESVIVRTPLISSAVLDEIAGGKILLKAENLQRTGSFKIRGAYNLLSQLTPEQSKNGAVAYSSGNHAQAVAAAGTMLGIDTTIVMPEDTPEIKISNTRKFGAKVVLYNRYTQDRELIAKEIADEYEAVLVPPYNHHKIIAGQGTVGLEISEQCDDLELLPDHVLVNCSGGGLTAGIATAIKTNSPATSIYAVEPEDFDDTRRSLISGRLEGNDPNARTICDALMSAPPGELTFEINKRLLSDVLVVSDDGVREAIRFAFRHLKLVVEPGGAVALAAVITGQIDTRDKITVVILSGGNIDAALFASIQQGE